MKNIMNLFDCLFCKNKSTLNLDRLPIELRFVILAYWYENKICGSKDNFVKFTSSSWHDHSLKVSVDKNNDFCFISPRLTREFISLFDIDTLTGLNIVKKQIRSNVIRQHVESYMMRVFFPFDLSGIGQARFYYELTKFLKDFIVCDRTNDKWHHYLTIEYIPSNVRFTRRKIKVYSNWELELFKLQIWTNDNCDMAFDVSDYQLNSKSICNYPDILWIFEDFRKTLGAIYKMKILDEGLLGSGKLESI